MSATTLNEKQRSAVIWFANAVASESAATTDHDKRLALARSLISGSGTPWIYFIEDCSLVSDFTGSTAQVDINNRLSGLATNMIALGLA